MHIPENGRLQGPHFQTHKPGTADRRATDPATNKADSGVTPVETSSTETLRSLVAASSDVRESLVQEIKLKLQAGEYLTKQAAYEAAEGILNL